MSRAIKILHIHCRYRERGGEDSVVDSERELLRYAGYEVIAYDTENPTDPVRALTRLMAAPWNPATYKSMRRLVRDIDADVAHVHNTWFSLSPSILDAIRHAGVPVLMTIHNYRLSCVNGRLFRDGGPCMDCVGSNQWSGVRHRCYRGSAALSAVVAATTQMNRIIGTWNRSVTEYLTLNSLTDDILTAAGVPPSKLCRTANFVPDPGPRPDPPSRSRSIVFVGRLSLDKGVDVLLDAWREWDGRHEWHLTIVGDGPRRAALESREVEGVDVVGRISSAAVTDLLRGARAMVVPSLAYENQPMVALEAFAAGVPVLARGFGGIGEVVGPLGRRWSVVDATRPAWTAALDVIADADAVDDAGRSARGEFERRFSPTAARTRARQLYDRVVSTTS